MPLVSFKKRELVFLQDVMRIVASDIKSELDGSPVTPDDLLDISARLRIAETIGDKAYYTLNSMVRYGLPTKENRDESNTIVQS